VLLMVGFIAVSIRNAEQGRWTQASFSLINAAFMTYALVYYIGLRALFEDITAGLRAQWRNRFYHAEIIPMPLRWLPSSISAKRSKRA
jgi:hypothetical protein